MALDRIFSRSGEPRRVEESPPGSAIRSSGGSEHRDATADARTPFRRAAERPADGRLAPGAGRRGDPGARSGSRRIRRRSRPTSWSAARSVGSGRLVLLHDPAGNAAWQGTFRCVTFARADVDPEMVTDPLLAQVGWSWLIDALASHGAEYVAPSGTVTSVSSESFGGMADEPPRAEVEVRASWTPQLADGVGFAAHLRPGLNYSVRRRVCRRCLPGWCRCRPSQP